MKSKKNKPTEKSSTRKPGKKYTKPSLTKHGLLDAEAAAFSTLY